MRAFALSLLIWLVAACASQPATERAAAPDSSKLPELHFAWKLPAAATVVHDVERDGARSTERYVICARSLGGGLMEVREVGHADGADRPVLLIAADGSVYDVVGLESALERMLAQRGAPAFRRGSLESPAILAQLKEKYAETWHLWVDTWLNFDPRQKQQVVQAFIPFGGVQIGVPQRFEYLGRLPERAELVKLRMRSVMEGRAASRALAEFMKGSMELDDPMRAELDRLELRRSVDYEIVTDPATLMPRRVRGSAITQVTIAGSDSKQRRESDDYQFDWELSAARRKACDRTLR